MSLYVSPSKFPQPHCCLSLRLRVRLPLPFMCLAFTVASLFPHLSPSPTTPPPSLWCTMAEVACSCLQAQGKSSTTVYLKRIDRSSHTQALTHTHTVPKHHACAHTEGVKEQQYLTLTKTQPKGIRIQNSAGICSVPNARKTNSCALSLCHLHERKQHTHTCARSPSYLYSQVNAASSNLFITSPTPLVG